MKHAPRWPAVAVRTGIAGALIALGLSWPRLLAGQSAWIERIYSESIYQTIRRAISAVTSRVPFSIAELLLYAFVVGGAFVMLVRVFQFALRRIPVRRLIGTLASIALTAGIVINLFYATWGFNYFRAPLSERMGLTIKQRSLDELEAFVRKTAGEANALRASLHEDGNGVFSPEESVSDIFLHMPQAYASLAKDDAVFQPDPTRVKQVLWSRGLSWQGISGIYIGLTAESNVNADQPSLLLYEAAAHEMAHQTGIAGENEAEFTAYLACLHSDDPNVRYSGLAFALIVSGNALFDADSVRYMTVCKSYSDAIWRDFAAYHAYWNAFDGEAKQSADRRNDKYLKHNSQQTGILSYGESVDLMLAYADPSGGKS